MSPLFSALPPFEATPQGVLDGLVEGEARATAEAHPIQGLVKYHGLRDAERRIPFHDSISLSTAPTATRTTLAVGREAEDVLFIDGERAEGRPLARARQVLDAVRKAAGTQARFVGWSVSNFPSRVGLGSSSSGFAALAVAAAELTGWDADPEHVSEAARLGAGSACRAVTGGVSEWITEGDRSFGRALPGGMDLPLATVVPLIPADVPTEGMHTAVLTSPLFEARCQYIPGRIEALRNAVSEKDAEAVAAIAEEDTLNLHAVTMTATPPHITWQPETLAVMKEVWRMREEERVPCWFSIDTGATPYVNTLPGHETKVAERLVQMPGVQRMLLLKPGGAAHLLSDHFF